MPSVAVDGQDVFAVYEAAREAVARARRGEGPSFIEAQTYRYYGHFEGDTVLYRTKEELEFYRSRDCLQRFRKTVKEQGLLSEADLAAVESRVKDAIEDAVRFAQDSQLPTPDQTVTDVYVSFPESQLWPFQATAA